MSQEIPSIPVHSFKHQGIEVPEKFPYPFRAEPHPIAKQAASELQEELKAGLLSHNFHETNESGKMFGVLVVRDSKGGLSYLAAYSGKILKSEGNDFFVPPIYDPFAPDSILMDRQKEFADMGSELDRLEADPKIVQARVHVAQEREQADKEITELKDQAMKAKQIRRARRSELGDSIEDQQEIEAMNKESSLLTIRRKALNQDWKLKLAKLDKELKEIELPISELRQRRKALSNSLQNQLFEAYVLKNANSETANLLEIFKDTAFGYPPAGSGDCAAPRLIQFAYENELTPVALAEFWWGHAPKSAIRKEGTYYRPCRGRCAPILNHTLKGLKVEKNPIIEKYVVRNNLDIIYEDEDLVAVNKPTGLLSAPGRELKDSVYTRMKDYLENATGPIIIHRLDMATSGILLVAKSEEIYKTMQSQFMNREIEKTYEAIISGKVIGETGRINLPMRKDILDRPRQMVCHSQGKETISDWKVIERKGNETRVEFYPRTGRTHQLRVHAAHSEGLGFPIKGDDLYGVPTDRLYLHASKIRFKHPRSGKPIMIELTAPY